MVIDVFLDNFKISWCGDECSTKAIKFLFNIITKISCKKPVKYLKQKIKKNAQDYHET